MTLAWRALVPRRSRPFRAPTLRPVTSRHLINLAALVAANVITAGGQYLIIVLVARRLGPESFGHFVFALTFGGLVVTLCNFGIDRVLIRAIVRQQDALSAYLWSAFALRATLAAVTMAGAAAILVALRYTGELRLTILLVVASLVLALFSELWRSALYASHAMVAEARLRAAGRFTALAAVAAAVWGGGRLLHVVIALSIAALVEVAIYTAGTWSRVAVRFQAPSARLCRELAVSAWPLAVNTLFVMVYFRFNIIMLTHWSGSEAAGIFGAAFTFVQALQVVSGSIAGVVLPQFVQRHADGDETLRGAVDRTTYLLLLGIVPVAVLLSMMAPDIIHLVYGARYDAAAPALRVLAWANIFMFIGSLYGTVLLVLHGERALMWMSIGAAMVSLAANRLLIPALGIVGASWASVATEALVAIVSVGLVWRRLGRLSLRGMSKPLAVGATLGLALAAAGDLGLPARGGVAIVALVLSVLIFRAMPPEAWRVLREMLRRSGSVRA